MRTSIKPQQSHENDCLSGDEGAGTGLQLILYRIALTGRKCLVGAVEKKKSGGDCWPEPGLGNPEGRMGQLTGWDLLPVVPSVRQALVHQVLETAVLLDENFAESAVLPKQDGLHADEFKQRQEHGDEGAL